MSLWDNKRKEQEELGNLNHIICYIVLFFIILDVLFCVLIDLILERILHYHVYLFVFFKRLEL